MSPEVNPVTVSLNPMLKSTVAEPVVLGWVVVMTGTGTVLSENSSSCGASVLVLPKPLVATPSATSTVTVPSREGTSSNL